MNLIFDGNFPNSFYEINLLNETWVWVWIRKCGGRWGQLRGGLIWLHVNSVVLPFPSFSLLRYELFKVVVCCFDYQSRLHRCTPTQHEHKEHFTWSAVAKRLLSFFFSFFYRRHETHRSSNKVGEGGKILTRNSSFSLELEERVWWLVSYRTYTSTDTTLNCEKFFLCDGIKLSAKNQENHSRLRIERGNKNFYSSGKLKITQLHVLRINRNQKVCIRSNFYRPHVEEHKKIINIRGGRRRRQ